MESGAIRRGLTRLYDAANALLFAKEMWLGIPAALALVASGNVAMRGWFETQSLIVQFTSAASAFLFLSVVMTGIARTVWRGSRTLNVLVSVKMVEVHSGGNANHCSFVGLREVTITTREHRSLSVDLWALWRFGDGRERRTDTPGFGRKHWLLNDQEPTITEADVRFFLGYSNAAYADPSLKPAEAAEAARAKAYLVIRDRVSGKELRLALQDGRGISDA